VTARGNKENREFERGVGEDKVMDRREIARGDEDGPGEEGNMGKGAQRSSGE